MKRTHNTELPIKRWNRNPVFQTNVSDRPRGFWYSINEDWKRFCLESNNMQWIGSYNYQIDISRANILQLLSINGVKRFAEKYGEKSSYVFWIDWSKVARDFDGIELQNFHNSISDDIATSWAYYWDCSSGCIWNLRNVRIKLI